MMFDQNKATALPHFPFQAVPMMNFSGCTVNVFHDQVTCQAKDMEKCDQ